MTTAFRQLHAPGNLLILPNAWDAGTARLIESCGAAAIATTSAGLAWAHGYPDGGALPPRIARAAVAEIRRVISVPLTVDVEHGYSSDPATVAETVGGLLDEGVVGINLEDGSDPPDRLCAKIEAVKGAAARAGVDLFVNARTDVYLRGLVPAGEAVSEVLERALRYRGAGCDGVFVPGVQDPSAIRVIAAGLGDIPLNVMAVPGLPRAGVLRELGVRRLSAGAALASAMLALVRNEARRFLSGESDDSLFATATTYAETNALFANRTTATSQR